MIEQQLKQQLKQYINFKKDLEKYFDSDEARQLITEYFIKISGWKPVFTDRITIDDIDIYSEEEIIIYYGCDNEDQEVVPIKWFFSEERNKIIEEKKERDLNEQILREEKLQKQKLAEEKAERNLYYLLKTKYGDVLNE
jgi:hypothetical protein